ncbi:hypothetical protein IAR50_003170 [Cryptococcus sp. DSM 104548]
MSTAASSRRSSFSSHANPVEDQVVSTTLSGTPTAVQSEVHDILPSEELEHPPVVDAPTDAAASAVSPRRLEQQASMLLSRMGVQEEQSNLSMALDLINAGEIRNPNEALGLMAQALRDDGYGSYHAADEGPGEIPFGALSQAYLQSLDNNQENREYQGMLRQTLESPVGSMKGDGEGDYRRSSRWGGDDVSRATLEQERDMRDESRERAGVESPLMSSVKSDNEGALRGIYEEESWTRSQRREQQERLQKSYFAHNDFGYTGPFSPPARGSGWGTGFLEETDEKYYEVDDGEYGRGRHGTQYYYD